MKPIRRRVYTELNCYHVTPTAQFENHDRRASTETTAPFWNKMYCQP